MFGWIFISNCMLCMLNVYVQDYECPIFTTCSHMSHTVRFKRTKTNKENYRTLTYKVIRKFRQSLESRLFENFFEDRNEQKRVDDEKQHICAYAPKLKERTDKQTNKRTHSHTHITYRMHTIRSKFENMLCD